MTLQVNNISERIRVQALPASFHSISTCLARQQSWRCQACAAGTPVQQGEAPKLHVSLYSDWDLVKQPNCILTNLPAVGLLELRVELN